MPSHLIYYIAGGAGALLLLAMFFRPARLLLRGVLKTIGGGAFLFLLNFAGQFVGFGISVNLLNACLIGLLGIPGLAAALVLGWIYP